MSECIGAMTELREALDERGIEWRKWTNGNVKTTWFVPEDESGYGRWFCTANVSKNHPDGPVYYKGYVSDARAAVEASLGAVEGSAETRGAVRRCVFHIVGGDSVFEAELDDVERDRLFCGSAGRFCEVSAVGGASLIVNMDNVAFVEVMEAEG